jgi:hypothetical protein
MAKFKAPRRSQKDQSKFQLNRAALPCLVLVIIVMVIVALVLYFALQGGSS